VTNKEGERERLRGMEDCTRERVDVGGRDERIGRGNIMRAVYRGTSELLLQNLPAYLHSPAASTDRN